MFIISKQKNKINRFLIISAFIFVIIAAIAIITISIIIFRAKEPIIFPDHFKDDNNSK